MREKITTLDRSDYRDPSAISATARTDRSWWLAACLIGLLIGLVIITQTLTSDRKVSAGQDYIHVVRVGHIQTGPVIIYNYQNALKPAPRITGQASMSVIDDTSSEQTYMQSCLAALTRGRNAEIMQLTEAALEEMCTDPRRK